MDIKKYLLPTLLSLFSVPLSYIATSFMMLAPFSVNYNTTVCLFTLSFNVTSIILIITQKK
ncbi:hypothetical protein K413DRAFT_4793 [Clostridium sp. ASBs410]|jgi:hypothetical protein|nr:hypothetical protein K413DRAFT_4793 [Clostridium sp. ASBs410]